MKITFSWMKNTLSCPQFSPQNTENRIWGIWKITVGYSIQTCWLLQFLMKPLLPLQNLKFWGGFLKKAFQFILKNQGKNFQPWKKHLSSPTLLGLFQTTCKLLLRLDGDFGWLPMYCFTAKPQTIISVVAN